MKKRHSTFSTTINHRELIRSPGPNSPLSGSLFSSSSNAVLENIEGAGGRKTFFRERSPPPPPLLIINFLQQQRSTTTTKKRSTQQQQLFDEFNEEELEIVKTCWRRIEEDERIDHRENLSNRLGFYHDDEEIMKMFGNQLVKLIQTTLDSSGGGEEMTAALSTDNASSTSTEPAGSETNLKSGGNGSTNSNARRSLSSFGSKLMSPASPNFDKKNKNKQLDSFKSATSSTGSTSGNNSDLVDTQIENKNLSFLYSLYNSPDKLDLIPTMHYDMLDHDGVELSSVQQIVNISTNNSNCSPPPPPSVVVFVDNDDKLCHNTMEESMPVNMPTFSLEILNPMITVDSFEDFSNPSFNALNIRYLYCDFWANKREFKQAIVAAITTTTATASRKSSSPPGGSHPNRTVMKQSSSSSYIPFEEIAKCQNCTELKLNNNKIRSFQSKYFTFSHLKELNLSCNRMEKSRLPEDLFSNMPCIEKLSLDYMGLKILPKSINRLVELTYLSISCNKLNTFNLLHGKDRHLNDFWPKLNRLEYLNLSGNRLNRFPGEICNCKSLEFLSLSNNRIANEIPKEIENLKRLNVLFLNGNKFTTLDINRNLEFLENLTHLELGHNPGIHLVPPPIYNLIKLESLCLNHLAISHLSDDVGKLQSLTHLDLYGSKIVGLPKSIAQLTNLKNLDMRYCRGVKEFPCELFGQKIESSTITTTSPMKSLTRLSLSFTMIESIPEDISSLLSLQVLLVNDCPLLEEIKGIDKLVNLVEFDISCCISLVEPPPDVCSRGLLHIRSYLKERNDGPSVFIKFIGSMFGGGGNNSNNSNNNKKKQPLINTAAENNLKVDHNELLVASPIPSINNDDDGDGSDDDDILDGSLKKNKQKEKSPSTVKSLFSFWK